MHTKSSPPHPSFFYSGSQRPSRGHMPQGEERGAATRNRRPKSQSRVARIPVTRAARLKPCWFRMRIFCLDVGMSPRACPLKYPALPRPYPYPVKKAATPGGLQPGRCRPGGAPRGCRCRLPCGGAASLFSLLPHCRLRPATLRPPALSCCPASGTLALLALSHGVFRGLYAGLWPAWPLPGPQDVAVTLPRRPQEPLCCCCPVQAGSGGEMGVLLSRSSVHFWGPRLGDASKLPAATTPYCKRPWHHFVTDVKTLAQACSLGEGWPWVQSCSP